MSWSSISCIFCASIISPMWDGLWSVNSSSTALANSTLFISGNKLHFLSLGRSLVWIFLHNTEMLYLLYTDLRLESAHLEWNARKYWATDEILSLILGYSAKLSVTMVFNCKRTEWAPLESGMLWFIVGLKPQGHPTPCGFLNELLLIAMLGNYSVL